MSASSQPQNLSGDPPGNLSRSLILDLRLPAAAVLVLVLLFGATRPWAVAAPEEFIIHQVTLKIFTGSQPTSADA